MKVYGLLSWYDEPAEWLAATVASCSKLCDGIVAVDGAYALFPDALRHPTSGPAQAATITETAAALGMSCTVHVPQGPWLGNEVEKLQFMFDMAPGVEGEDWYLKLDADELLSDAPYDVRDRLAETDKHIVELRMWDRIEWFGQKSMWPIRRLYRALPGMRIGPAHHIFTALVDGERQVITDSENRGRQIEALDMQDLRLEHRHQDRPQHRQENIEHYYHQRDELGVEKEDEWPTSQQPISANGQSSHTAPISS